jgi:hypothetical protein
MIGQESSSGLGQVKVFVAENRGFTAEEIAERAIEKIIFVGNESAPEVREQALAYKAQIQEVLVKYLKDAQANERLTICNRLTEAGLSDAADFIKTI